MKSLVPPVAVIVCVGIVFGCKATKPNQGESATITQKPFQEAPKIVKIDYVDSDGFDLLFETALVSAQPAIRVQTEYAKPEWGMRLNNWIAAWNAGHRGTGVRARGQIPVAPSIVVDGDSIREFRLLVNGLMNRVEDSARLGGHWWAEKHTREQRIAILRPYNLRFHLDADERIHLIFCHSDYAAQHKEIVRSLADPADEESLDWFPGYCCSESREHAKKDVRNK